MSTEYLGIGLPHPLPPAFALPFRPLVIQMPNHHPLSVISPRKCFYTHLTFLVQSLLGKNHQVFQILEDGKICYFFWVSIMISKHERKGEAFVLRNQQRTRACRFPEQRQ